MLKIKSFKRIIVKLMDNIKTISCPHCKKNFELSSVLMQHLFEGFKVENEKDTQERIDQERIKAVQEYASKKELELQRLTDDSSAKDKRIEDLLDQLTKLTGELRETRKEKEEAKLQAQKELSEKETEIRKQAQEKAMENVDLKLKEKDGVIERQNKKIMELQASTTSQQLQGETLEIEIEKQLRDNFIYDDILPIEKGVIGADIKQVVKTSKGTVCGIILWELKRTKDWSDTWIPKLKANLAREKANIPVIVSLDLPIEAKNGFGVKNDVWVCGVNLVIPLCTILRQKLIDVGRERFYSQNKESKAEKVYSYITSHEFAQQVQAIVETYHEIIDQVGKERGSYERLWAQRESQANKILQNTARIIGSIEGRGTPLQQIKGIMELEEGVSNDSTKTQEPLL